MMPARAPLLLIVTTGDAERLRGALTVACAEAALGGSVHIFLQLDAVALLSLPIVAPRDADHAAHGLPTLAALIDDGLALGVTMTACQSGLALAGLAADAIDPRIAVGGPVGVLSRHGGEDRLLLV